MKILHVIPSLSVSSGGPAQIVTQLCQELKNQGIEAVIAAAKMEKMQGESNTVPVYYFTRQFNSFLPLQFAFSYGLKNWLKQHIREFDLLHIHYLFTYPSTIACHYANKYKIPYLITPFGMLNHACLRKSAFRKRLYTLFFEKRNLKNAGLIHFASEEEMVSARSLKLNNRYITVPYGLDLERFRNLGSLKGVFRKNYPQINGRKIILFLSRIDPKKGLDILIPALRILSERHNDFVFVLAGSGIKDYERWAEYALARAGLTESTILTGLLEGRMKFAVLADADIFVLSSYDENFGIAVAEAMAAGLPVVISNRVNIYKLIEDYQAGIVTGLNSQDIALALDRLLSDECLREKMGANGKRLVEENFDVKKTTNQMVRAYSRLISRSKS